MQMKCLGLFYPLEEKARKEEKGLKLATPSLNLRYKPLGCAAGKNPFFYYKYDYNS